MSSLAIPAFEQFAQTYDTATPIQSQVAEYLTQLIKRYQTDFCDICIIDVGCGTGKLTNAVLSAILQNPTLSSVNVYGIDNSENMLEIWQQRIGHLFSSNISKISLESQSVYANMADISLPSQYADLVMSSFALHWTATTVIEELTRLVKPSGQLHLAIPVAGSFSEVSQRFPELPIFDFLPSQNWLERIDTVVKKRKANILYQFEHSFSYPYENLQSLIKNLKQMGGAVSGKDPIATGILKQYLRDKSSINLDYNMLIIGLKF